MSSLKDLCGRLAGFRHPRPPERLTVERSCQRLSERETSVRRVQEPWAEFIARIDLEDLGNLRPKDLKRAVEELWSDPELEKYGTSIVNACASRYRKSFDRRMIQAYLGKFPIDCAAFPALAQACREGAKRHDWPWQVRGDRWHLWDPENGPELIGQEFLSGADISVILREAGLDGELALGGFAKTAIRSACFRASSLEGADAEAAGTRLIQLFDRVQGASDVRPMMAYALLAPWVRGKCSEEHQRAIIGSLVMHIGDPRLKGTPWAAVGADAREWAPEGDVESAFGVLRRWLVQTTVRQFFEIVAKTTDRPDQWQQRTAFWLQYLDAGVITDAWFAFGSMAERAARTSLRDENVDYARIEGQGADASHSALVFSLGDLRIAEWSHNGMTRFWRSTDAKAPPLYEPVYFALVLRAMNGGPGFETIAHMGSWQWRFAKHIHQETGISHPKYGSGW
jgi:hypothetical protein